MTSGVFTLVDLDGVLEPENATTIGAALDRTSHPLWKPRRWQIVDPAGRNAYSAPRTKEATP
ncbi:hypothetical protein SEA_YEEZY_59 [Gordonia phage Yeezy]|uniref:Uncharacterized protein n=2 Tax=Baxterfoxvirus TaxID=3044672 RepID=A0A7G8LGB7_9CAUD|nr:hypothetical protein SEA_YEEZY_59 [Gordonia phage Yeezy]YP_010653335.1 hypothetical protein PP492_gp60 [Gordonia phage Ohgeesy]AMS02804.1 hypothetical protein SEA_YEEZY_59 [Gordonia phage Yeezy]QNJ56289.1 hypothetical protein SEA_OHGEESY_60 [Gordonia phage Ohgeesy]